MCNTKKILGKFVKPKKDKGSKQSTVYHRLPPICPYCGKFSMHFVPGKPCPNCGKKVV